MTKPKVLKCTEKVSSTGTCNCKSNPNEIVGEVFTFDSRLVKLVIGMGGNVITPIKTKTSTSIFVTSWKQNKEEKFGAIIYGKRSNVIEAKLCLREAVRNAESIVKNDKNENGNVNRPN